MDFKKNIRKIVLLLFLTTRTSRVFLCLNLRTNYESRKTYSAGVSGILAAAVVPVATFESQEYTEGECLNLFADDLATHNELLMSAINTNLSQDRHNIYLSLQYILTS